MNDLETEGAEESDAQLPLLTRRDVGLFGVLNEIANSEEEGECFPSSLP